MYQYLSSKDAKGEWKEQKSVYRIGKTWDMKEAKEVYALYCRLTTRGHTLGEKRVGIFKKETVKLNGEPNTPEYLESTGDKAWASRTAKKYNLVLPK